jgi:hypothetical protein
MELSEYLSLLWVAAQVLATNLLAVSLFLVALYAILAAHRQIDQGRRPFLRWLAWFARLGR